MNETVSGVLPGVSPSGVARARRAEGGGHLGGGDPASSRVLGVLQKDLSSGRKRGISVSTAIRRPLQARPTRRSVKTQILEVIKKPRIVTREGPRRDKATIR
jgi:hypothetical protein